MLHDEARLRAVIRMQPEQPMLSLDKATAAQELAGRIGEGCACKRNPVLRRRAAPAEVPQNPRARTGRGCAARVRMHGINEKGLPAKTGKPFYLFSGGDGGNRTRVRKHSTDSSTYLALPFNLTGTTRTCTLCTSELPII